MDDKARQRDPYLVNHMRRSLEVITGAKHVFIEGDDVYLQMILEEKVLLQFRATERLKRILDGNAPIYEADRWNLLPGVANTQKRPRRWPTVDDLRRDDSRRGN